MKLLKIFIIAITLTGCAHTFSDSESKGIPEFESLVGSGVLEINSTGIASTPTEAWVTVSDNETIPNRKGCKVLMLKSTDELVIKIAHCADKQEYIICGGDDSECVIDFKTKKSGSTLSLINDYRSDEVRHVVNFHQDSIIYRIQLESCLIPYPHGCIIDGFSWIDLDTYTFRKH
ncbi:MAG: hypothetical protein ACI9OH_002469 [Oleispira sp.]|jgi:hypothetical protein